MSFITKLLTGEFNFIIPVSFMIFGVFFAAIVFTVRYRLYKKRKQHFSQQQGQVDQSNAVKREV